MKKNSSDLLPENRMLSALLEGRLNDPHSILGMHKGSSKDNLVIRVFDPMAESVTVLHGTNDSLETVLTKVHPDGLFAADVKAKQFFKYQIRRTFFNGTELTARDPYSFLPAIGEMDIYLFNTGENHRVYDSMGAHCRKIDDADGVVFTVWAPNAERVSVVGNFNCWDGRRNPMRLMGNSGIWELFVPGVLPGEVYKYELRAKNGDVFSKLDPYTRRTELRPSTAGIVADPAPFVWTDGGWMKKRSETNVQKAPMNVYEVHLGSWGGPGTTLQYGEDDFSNYRELAHALGDYVLEMGYTHVELLPICEHPLDQSWGYQVTGFFAPTARYGSPEDFAYFVDYMHSLGIGVILDWVPAHFPKDAFALGRFDGTALYEHSDPRQGEHKDWGTYIFNFGRSEVRCFLIGSALFWLEQYHIDGLRVDAVASMLYLDYSRKAGEWIPNKYGGNENLDAISFLKHLNELAHEMFPGIAMIAEESTAWPGVSKPVYLGGLGFTFKWNMGWMHDTLEYYALDPVFRSYNHSKLTFSLLYAFSENFVLPLSHDEVVHGKHSLLDKMPGDYQQKFANLRSLYAYMTMHPGKKLLFMGGEFAQWLEWNESRTLDWNLLKYPQHSAIRKLVCDLNHFYKENPALWSDDFSPEGFTWLDGGDYKQSIFSFIRWDGEHKNPVVVILNLTPVVRDPYTTGVPLPGVWEEVLNTDHSSYGGTHLLNTIPMQTKDGLYHGQPYHLSLRLPWLGAVILKPKKA